MEGNRLVGVRRYWVLGIIFVVIEELWRVLVGKGYFLESTFCLFREGGWRLSEGS